MTWLVHFAGVWVSQTLQICSSGLNRPKNENKENERKTESKPKDREQAEKQNFLAFGDLVKNSNKIFIRDQGGFLPIETRHDGMSER